MLQGFAAVNKHLSNRGVLTGLFPHVGPIHLLWESYSIVTGYVFGNRVKRGSIFDFVHTYRHFLL